MDYPTEEKVAAAHVPDATGTYESPAPEKMTAGRYAATRLITLKPPMNKAPNPFTLLAMLSGKQWLFFFCGFIAWVNPTLPNAHCTRADIR
jgi:SHS family lactate transporter-like MFS transporter